MIAALLMAAAVASVPAGPGLRLGRPNPDGTPVILALDHDGKIAARITCIRNQWVDPDDSAAKLLASPEVAATILNTDGKLSEIEQLGPSKFDCLIMPDDGG